MGLIECALWRRPEHFGGSVEPVELDEDGAGFLGAAPAHGGEGALDVATAKIGRHPDRGFKTHRADLLAFQARVSAKLNRKYA